jgi:hypothetical protein
VSKRQRRVTGWLRATRSDGPDVERLEVRALSRPESSSVS